MIHLSTDNVYTDRSRKPVVILLFKLFPIKLW
ncbi:hypothetical protein kac65v162_gp187 [Nodularia phage vB_NspS-kac65v162]|uniref:Uncharacterized protein n=3 Tax=Ravarandavirus kac65v151 TaxID=2845689 RepID=A0A482MIK0_9CAUD|nr:hypothetical protein HWC12_gp130 [Nodularia phage vB_NspS-kac65v151]QBQ73217.1 hypothetical protein kac65v151_gp187 [Nodularia phage vB_NspS-kac65v151]QBQ73425.1 hypothetical protein kac65v161_gp187 [Nodularia phage vB_NspS-kac65v161]QBQ73631.1 hypothetical protein kac65v162_gp187 [Nodularia phage vB_NspS-kac65v162]